jgi:TatD DNase family protein
MLIDSHCHLDFPDFDGERDEITRAARNAPASDWFVTISTRVAKFDRIRAIAEQYPMRLLLGGHPSAQCGRRKRMMAVTDRGHLVRTCRSHEKVVAIGEAGLDYHLRSLAARGTGARPAPSYRRRPPHRACRWLSIRRDAEDDMAAASLTEETGKGRFAGASALLFSSAREARP